jgi:nickel/cobalt transporter (NicO) family protein
MRHRLLGRAVAVAAAAALPFALATPAGAHPLGNFTVNAASGITVGPGRVRITYVLDLAEIPTFQALASVDADGSGDLSEEERAAWAEERAADLLSGLSFEVEGAEVLLRPVTSAMNLLPGQGGLQVLRLEATFIGETPDSGRAEYTDRNDPGRIGWREITAVGTKGIAVTDSSVPVLSPSDRLRAYPEDLLSSPPEVRRASFEFGPGVQTGTASSGEATGSRPEAPGGALGGLVARPALSVSVILLALGIAFGAGALHALAPGHGKALMAAYLVGTGDGIRDAVAIAAAVAGMHTGSVLGLGILVLTAGRAFPVETVYPWLGLVAGAAALGIGGVLIASRLRSPASSEHHHHHPPLDRPLSRRGLTSLALSGGILPSPTAIVTLLGSIAIGRAVFGTALIGAFSLGLAATLTVVGMVAARAGARVAPRLGRWTRLVPIGSAAAIVALGTVLVARAAHQLL